MVSGEWLQLTISSVLLQAWMPWLAQTVPAWMALAFGTAVTKGMIVKATMAMMRVLSCMLVVVLCAQ